MFFYFLLYAIIYFVITVAHVVEIVIKMSPPSMDLRISLMLIVISSLLHPTLQPILWRIRVMR